MSWSGGAAVADANGTEYGPARAAQPVRAGQSLATLEHIMLGIGLGHVVWSWLYVTLKEIDRLIESAFDGDRVGAMRAIQDAAQYMRISDNVPRAEADALFAVLNMADSRDAHRAMLRMLLREALEYRTAYPAHDPDPAPDPTELASRAIASGALTRDDYDEMRREAQY